MATQPIQDYKQYPYPGPAGLKQGRRSPFARAVDRAADFLIAYWAHLLTAFLGLLVVGALTVPFLSYFGLNSIAKPIFYSLHYVCAQIPSHSFYVFGHQLGMCARNFSIYSSMFLGCVVFLVSKKRFPGIPWWLWILMMTPMAWDGITQMFGWRESTWILRFVTGTLFGLGNVWFALPLMHKSIMETAPIPAPLLAQRRAMQQMLHSQPPLITQPDAQAKPQSNAE